MALVFCFTKEGTSWHGQSCAQALASLLPTGSSLSSDFGNRSYVHNSRPPSYLPTEDVPIQPSGASRGGLVTPSCHGGDVTRGMSFQWQPSAAHLPVGGMDQTALGCCEMGTTQRLGMCCGHQHTHSSFGFLHYSSFQGVCSGIGCYPNAGLGRALST